MITHCRIAAVVAALILCSGCLTGEDEPLLGEESEELDLSGVTVTAIEPIDLPPPILIRPTISAISPTTAAPGAVVTITGRNFDRLFRGPAAFGSTTDTAARSTLTYVSATQLTVVVPAGAQPGPISLLSSLVLAGQPPAVQVTSTQTFTPIVAPAAPSNLALTVSGSSRIDLAWNDNSWNETGFEVWILEAGAWRVQASVGANVRTLAATNLRPSTAYGFRVRARNATGTSAYSNAPTATTTSNLGTVVFTNNAQIGADLTFNGTAVAPISTSGNQGTYRVAAGAYFIEAILTMSNGAWVCSLGSNQTVTANQTTNVNVAPLTAGQVLTHCQGYADYVQGSYVDQRGFHTVVARIHASGRFEWWHDNVLMPAQTITSTSFSAPWLSFTLSGGDSVSMGWPFGSLQMTVNGYVVQMTRDVGW